MPVIYKCLIGGAFKVNGELVACAHSVVGRQCGLPGGEICSHRWPDNMTMENIEVKVGQVWRDLDKRMNGRMREVIAVDGGKAIMGGTPKTKVSISRMHKGSTGWELVQDVSK